MRRSLRPLLSVAFLCAGAGVASADAMTEVQARQDYFKSLGAEMKVLGGLSKSYDAGKAKASAGDLSKILSTDFRSLFPEGTSAKDVKGSEAKAKIWTHFDDFLAHEASLKQAGANVVAAADKEDAAGFRTAFLKMGESCKSCHDSYRAH